MNKIWIIGLLAILLVCGCTDSEPTEITKYQCIDNTFVDSQADCRNVEPVIKRIEIDGVEYMCLGNKYDCDKIITEVEWQYR